MISPKIVLLVLLGVVAVAFALYWAVWLTRRRQWQWPSKYYQLTGFVTNFFDTLGIGSYATTTAIYRLKKSVTDETLPGTLNVGHCLPVVVQAFVYLSIVKVDEWTLAITIAASVLGAWLGAGLVVRFSRRTIQLWLGMALLVAAGMLLGPLFNLFPAGGDSLSLHGTRLLIAVVGNFVFGALMMIGVGAYAPIMIMVSLLGMNPKAAFPIMMGSSRFLSPWEACDFYKRTSTMHGGAGLDAGRHSSRADRRIRRARITVGLHSLDGGVHCRLHVVRAAAGGFPKPRPARR